MENKEIKKTVPVELDEETLNVVSGGLIEITGMDGEVDVSNDCSDASASVMSGSMLR